MTKRMKEFKAMCEANRLKSQTGEKLDFQEKGLSDKYMMCLEFFQGLEDILKDRYTVVASCNKDASKYLVPKGTEKDITYYGKPEMSFRVSDHWNWYTGIARCKDPNYIQCNSLDMPRAREREEEGKGTNGRRGFQVAIQLSDGCYHGVYGEFYDRKNKRWSWVETSPMDVCKHYRLV